MMIYEVETTRIKLDGYMMIMIMIILSTLMNHQQKKKKNKGECKRHAADIQADNSK